MNTQFTESVESTKTVKIYFDPYSACNHNPNFGSMENGRRTLSDSIFRPKNNQKYTVIYPKLNADILTKLNLFHKENPTLQFLASEPFGCNFLQRFFDLIPGSMYDRNCRGCTMHSESKICSMCETRINKNDFYRFAHLIDKNISDSDTTYVTHTSYAAVQSAISLVTQMIDDLYSNKLTKQNGFAIVRPPGHHASKTKSEGFCLVNNIAFGAEYGLSIGFKKIFIFDFDAHHGNGTQQIFYDRSDVFYCSIHTLEAYPKTGAESEIGEGEGELFTLNIIVEKGVDEETYLDKFATKVIPAIRKFRPDLILVSAGFDGLATDPMKLMNLDPQTYAKMINQLVGLEVAVGMVLEGGYDLVELPNCINLCIDELIN